MFLLYTVFLLACKPIPAECLCPEDFINTWWQIELSSGPYGNCYLFEEDGHIVESDGSDAWPIGQWELRYDQECQYSIITEEAEIKIFGMNEDCLELEYENKNYTACECKL
jgi:hypothetical protein